MDAVSATCQKRTGRSGRAKSPWNRARPFWKTLGTMVVRTSAASECSPMSTECPYAHVSGSVPMRPRHSQGHSSQHIIHVHISGLPMTSSLSQARLHRIATAHGRRWPPDIPSKNIVARGLGDCACLRCPGTRRHEPDLMLHWDDACEAEAMPLGTSVGDGQRQQQQQRRSRACNVILQDAHPKLAWL